MQSNKSDSSFVVKLLRNCVLLLVLGVFTSIVYNYFQSRENITCTAVMSEAVASEEFQGVFVRKEEAITFSGNGVLSYSVADGGKLGAGTVIAKAYPDDSQISIDRQIEKLEKKLSVLKKIQNPGTLESVQPASLSENIEESYRSLIYSRDMNELGDIEKNMENLLVQMSTYQLITNEVSSFGQQITDINSELGQLRSQAVSPSEIIKSPRSAYFVSYCDGYESELTPEKLSTISVAEVRSITDRKSSDPKIVGKMIDGYGWYLVGIIDNSRKEYAVNDRVKLRFDSSADTFPAEIKDIRDEGNSASSIVVVYCEQFNSDLVQHRAEKCELIKEEYKGLRVPRNAIRFSGVEETVVDEKTNSETTVLNNCKGVYIQKGEQIEFKKIDVIYEGSDYVLSDVHNEDDSYLSLYDDIISEGVNINDN